MTNFEKACENINTFQFFIYQIQRGVRPCCIPDINKCKSYLSECTLCERDWLNKEYDENDNFWTNTGYWDEIVKRAATVQSIRLKTQFKHDEGIILENLLLRLVALDANPVLPHSNRTFSFLMTDKQRKALGDCIYKYLGEHYPESSIAQIQQIVKEAK